MISYLSGKIAVKEPTYLVIDVNGMGYEVKISLMTYDKVRDLESVKINTYFHVKEDSHVLFGFFYPAEKSVFLDLIGISGIGPNTALVMLSSLNHSQVKSAIANEEVKTVESIKGIGIKTAQRIILELKNKYQKEVPTTGDALAESSNTTRNEALKALVRLGFNRPAAQKSIDSLLKKHGRDIMLEELIKLALKTT